MNYARANDEIALCYAEVIIATQRATVNRNEETIGEAFEAFYELKCLADKGAIGKANADVYAALVNHAATEMHELLGVWTPVAAFTGNVLKDVEIVDVRWIKYTRDAA